MLITVSASVMFDPFYMRITSAAVLEVAFFAIVAMCYDAKGRRLFRWIWNQLMRIPPRVEIWGWLTLLITGIGVEAGTGWFTIL